MRIVSLLPSATEIVYALGRGEDLEGVTFECDFPPEARGKRVVSSSGLEASTDSPDAIDAAVRSATEGGTPLYRLDEAAIAAIDPQVILTQDLCRVCAVPSGDVDEALGRLGCSAEVVSLDPHTLDEVVDDIDRVGAVLDVPDRAAAVTAALRSRLEVVRASVADRPRRRVLLLEWVDPPFGAGHWIPDQLRAAGGEPVLAAAGTHSGALTWDDVRDAAPDVIVVAPCGFGLVGAVEHATQALPHLPDRAEVWAVDGDAYVVRPGPRLVDGVEVLAALLRDGTPPPDAATRVR
ncbi:MAG TPA: cobalamin-binding protein [Acidimicrobiales bacterium]|nr:cobalamin-binding protein [Acidimicrobiales bacterium]